MTKVHRDEAACSGAPSARARSVRGRALALTAALAALSLGAAACGGSSSSSSSSSSSASSSAAPAASSSAAPAASGATAPVTAASGADVKGKKVYLVTCEPNVFCHAYNANLAKELKAAGVSVTQLSDNFDPALQDQHMNQAIAAKPDAIIVFASNIDAIVPALKRAKAAGVPTINVDGQLRPAGAAEATFQVVANNKALGEFAAANLVSGMQKAGYTKGRVIAVTGTAGTLIVDDRMDAFKAALAKYPQYKLDAVVDGNWDQVKSAQLSSQLFSKYASQGGVQGVYSMADYMAAGTIQAAQQLSLKTGAAPGDVVVTASNCSKSGITLMKAGTLWGNATQSPLHESDTAAKAVIAFLGGQEQPKLITDVEEGFTAADYTKYEPICNY